MGGLYFGNGMMPTILEKIDKTLYTTAEIELSIRLEEIIFKINLQSKGEFTRGAKFDEIVKGLEKKGLYYSDIFILNLLKKLKKEFILQEIDNKWFSTLM